MLFGAPVLNASQKVAEGIGGAGGWFAGIATSVGGNGGLGVLATATTNWMEGKPDVLEGAKNAFILNASAPLLSAEAPLLVAGAGLSAMTETTFGAFTNAINLIEAYLPATRTQHVPTPLPNPRK